MLLWADSVVLSGMQQRKMENVAEGREKRTGNKRKNATWRKEGHGRGWEFAATSLEKHSIPKWHWQHPRASEAHPQRVSFSAMLV